MAHRLGLLLAMFTALAPLPAAAADLWSGMLDVGPMQYMTCRLTNLTDKARTATIVVLEADGAVHSTSNVDFPADIPGASLAQSGPIATDGGCRFIVPGGAKKWRATACVWDASLGCIAAVEAH
jgi:hypothetical protein